jgi:uncharacterized protein
MLTDKQRILRSEFHEFMSKLNVMTLAYQDANGPGACAVWYAVAPDLTCYFLSTTNTQHGRAMEPGANVAFTVQKDNQDWRQIQGVQGKGYCHILAPEQRESGWQTYSARFPFVLQTFGNIASALALVSIWSITPSWLRLIDNTKGFGHKEELVFE